MGTETSSSNKMKPLFISHHREKTGSGKMARDYITALDAVGIDVVARAIKLNNSEPELNEAVLKAEQKEIDGIDTVIQCVLAHHMEYVGGIKNIGLVVYEAIGNNSCNWGQKLNLMDEVWCPSSYTKHCLTSMGVYKPIKVVPMPCDISVFDRQYDKLTDRSLEGRFIFGTVCDMVVRKNLPAIIQAFHLAFTPNYPVSLLIKTSKYGASSQQVADMVISDCSRIKQGMKLYGSEDKYFKEVLITDDLSDEQMNQVYNTMDCFITASHGESWSIPTFMSMGFGKTVIAADTPENIPYHYDFLNDSNCIKVPSELDICFGEVNHFAELYTSRELWNNVNIAKLAKSMKFVYDNRNSDRITNISKTAKESVKLYSYSEIGKVMKELLCL